MEHKSDFNSSTEIERLKAELQKKDALLEEINALLEEKNVKIQETERISVWQYFVKSSLPKVTKVGTKTIQHISLLRKKWTKFSDYFLSSLTKNTARKSRVHYSKVPT